MNIYVHMYIYIYIYTTYICIYILTERHLSAKGLPRHGQRLVAGMFFPLGAEGISELFEPRVGVLFWFVFSALWFERDTAMIVASLSLGSANLYQSAVTNN